MIPQFFVKSSGEQINFGKFDYVKGATLIYDWGNPNSYSASQGAGGITSNFITGGEPQANFVVPGPAATDMWSSAYSGSIQFNASNDKWVEYASSFPTGAMSVVSVYKPDEFENGAIVGQANNNGLNLAVSTTNIVTPTIWYGASGNTQQTLSCNVTMVSDYNGWNVVTFATNGLDRHTMYLNNGSTNSTDTNTYNRSLYSPTSQDVLIGDNALTSGYLNGVMMAYLVYPFELSPKQIRQNWYVFKQRMTLT